MPIYNPKAEPIPWALFLAIIIIHLAGTKREKEWAVE